MDLEASVRQCKICSHAQRERIDQLLMRKLGGVQIYNTDIARTYGMSEASVRRHLENHFRACEECGERLPLTQFSSLQAKRCLLCDACPICGDRADEDDELCERCRKLEQIESVGARRTSSLLQDAPISRGKYIERRNLWSIQQMLEERDS